MEREMVCIECPRGCTLLVTKTGGRVRVSGNFCPRGEAYAAAEVTQPRRVLTSTVRGEGGMIPVRTSSAVKKEKIFQIMERVRAYRAEGAVKLGDVLIPDVDGEGTALIATADAVRLQED